VSGDLDARLEALGRNLGEREVSHGDDLERARRHVVALRDQVAAAIDRFHAAASAAGAPHLRITVGEVHVDDKHLRALEFDLRRGRHRAIVTAKSRGDVTLVGPFHMGKNEGPCQKLPFDSDEISAALGDFLEKFLEQAASP
jgi:hypothetical protein